MAVHDSGSVRIPEDLPRDRILLWTDGAFMGLSCEEDLDRIVYVDPKACYEMPYAEKTMAARAVSAFNAGRSISSI